MITEKEINAVQLSAAKKDFYQIWEELIDTARKISERWDPKSTNESDPGIVLLKVLTGIADKLNYNTDVNILEAFMPSAAQMESMRKLCEMLGYNIKYYHSAETDVTFSYIGDDSKWDNVNELTIPLFTVISNSDNDVNYVTTESKVLSYDSMQQTIPCIEGQVAKCESDNNGVITVDQLDDNYRYYLPETQIAENGVFIYRINDGIKSERWRKVDNLNVQSFGSPVYKFGFDSRLNCPYVQFPADIGQIIEDGLEIYYVRTNGVNGNISARTLSTFNKPAEPDAWEDFEVSDFYVTNASAATNGSDIETINQAYNSFKKTIGTFDTLVTCRDYMNAIYRLMDASDIPLVSNVVVSDIRDDINRSVTICGLDDYGISYVDTPVKQRSTKTFADDDNPTNTVRVTVDEDKINHFDLLLYPFNTVRGLNTEAEYKNSFKYNGTTQIKNELEANLATIKTIAHNFCYPNDDEVVCIKNYLKLNATITTATRVNIIEEQSILANIKTALFKEFNARKLDFGEEIPYDSIFECISNADARIKNVAMADPVLYTKFLTASGEEYDTASFSVIGDGTDELLVQYPGRAIYNKLALRNILAGRIALLNYSKDFSFDLTEKKYSHVIDTERTEQEQYPSVFPEVDKQHKIIGLKPYCRFDTEALPITLTENELVRFRAPNFKTEVTYPAYVNYFLKINQQSGTVAAIPATLITLKEFMARNGGWTDLLEAVGETHLKLDTVVTADTFDAEVAKYGKLFNADYEPIDEFDGEHAYYYLPLNSETFPSWSRYIKSLTYQIENSEERHYNGLYYSLGYNFERMPGYMVDKDTVKYNLCNTWHTTAEDSALAFYYVQETHSSTDDEDNTHTADGLGRNAVHSGIKKDMEYQLQRGEYLAINYTPSSDDSGETEAEPINKLYKEGDIIRPNFEMIDSATKRANGSKYYKTSGYSFLGKIPEITEELPGMYSFGTSEKVEIRNVVKVSLTGAITYLYWIMNDEEAFESIFDETPTPVDDVRSYWSYTLQNGEYLFYTDSNKVDMAYYGSGSELRFYNGLQLHRTSGVNELDADAILDKGLNGIPWVKFSRGDSAQSRRLDIIEYQYKSLADGDVIESISIPAEGGLSADIDNKWKAVSNVTYKTSGDGSSTNLPPINVIDPDTRRPISWSVRSFLEVSASQYRSQSLSANDKIDVVFNDDTVQTLAPRFASDSATAVIPLSFKTNYPCGSTNDYINVKVATADDQNKNDFKIKLFESMAIGAVTGSDDEATDSGVVKLHNFSSALTSLSFNDLNQNDEYVKFYLNIPDGSFGIVTINYSGEFEDKNSAFILPIDDEGNTVDAAIFNYPNCDNETWWSDLVKLPDTTRYPRLGNVYYLRQGINVVKITESCELRIYPDKNKNESILISDPSVVDAENPINMRLLDYCDSAVETYRYVDTNTESPNPLDTYIIMPTTVPDADKAYRKATAVTAWDGSYTWYVKTGTADGLTLKQRVLSDINKLDLDHRFYYNCPLDSGMALDLNLSLLGTRDEMLLSDESVWYDYNNVNNKFVISEIDADYLSSGIQISMSSKH